MGRWECLSICCRIPATFSCQMFPASRARAGLSAGLNVGLSAGLRVGFSAGTSVALGHGSLGSEVKPVNSAGRL